MKLGLDLLRLVGGTAFWVIVGLVMAGYLAPLAQYIDDDVRLSCIDRAEAGDGHPK